MSEERDPAVAAPRAGSRGRLPTRAGSRTLTILLIVAAALFITFAARELSWLLAPLALAVLVVTLVHPVYTALRARGFPGILALLALLLAVYGSITMIVVLIAFALARFASLLPQYARDIEALIRGIRDNLRDLGIAAPQTKEMLEWVDIPALARWLTGQIPSIVSLAVVVVLVGTVLVFLGIESTQLTMRAWTLRTEHPRLYGALALTASRTRRFFLVTTIFAIIVGVLDTLVLVLLDIPLAPLWGLLAAVCNYIPYLGFWIGMIPPALLGLALHGWETMLIIVSAYIVLNFVITSLLPTKFVSDAVGLSMTVEVLAIAYWAWVLGPLGAILAIPITITIKAVLVDTNPRAAWLGGFIDSSKSMRTQPQYRRTFQGERVG